jgi:hypothetical protein
VVGRAWEEVGKTQQNEGQDEYDEYISGHRRVPFSGIEKMVFDLLDIVLVTWVTMLLASNCHA